MKQLFKTLTVATSCLLLMSISSLALVPASAAFAAAPVGQAANDPCGNTSTSAGQVLSGAGEAANSDNCSGAGVNTLAGTVVSILSIIVGVLAILMIIYSGFKYITSGGDSNKTASAKSSLIYALVGLAIAATAQVIVHDVLDSAIKAVGSMVIPR